MELQHRSSRIIGFALLANVLAAGSIAATSSLDTRIALAPDQGPPAGTLGATVCAESKTRGPDLLAAGRIEPTQNQRSYDARYYGIALSIDPGTKTIGGTTTLRVTVTHGPLTSLDLDLVESLVISEVREGSAPVHFQRTRGVVTVQLSRPYQTGEDITLDVDYSGAPSDIAFHFDRSENQPMIWTLSAPYGARAWWPCKDYPEDKADSVDIDVRAPAGFRVAANGVRRAEIEEGPLSRTLWHEGHPIATYLVSVAIHPYATYSDWYHPVEAPSDSMPILFFNFRSNVDNARPVQAKVKTMIAAFAERFGEFPFLDEKYGHAEFLFSGGMENQTISGLGTYAETVVAHELSHEWWGDMVTCADFHDIWLNEGFATYCEALWLEASQGPAAYHERLNQTAFFGSGTIRVDDVGSRVRIYDRSLSYLKGSWVLHMLRHVVGDDAFFRTFREYRRLHAEGVATTGDFESAAEEVSGKDLGPFFRQWISGERYPMYRFDWGAERASGGWDVNLRIRQMQAWQLFTMPIDVTISSGTIEQTFVVENSAADTTYILHVDREPDRVALDKDHWILAQVMEPIPRPAFTKPLLLVNGMSWTSPPPTNSEIRQAYATNSFTGGYAYDFWDCFARPADGYPSNLPSPIGQGVIPGDVLGQYQCVVWLSNNFGGDAGTWQTSPVHAYLEAGGDVLLMTRDAGTFLSDPFREYLGITWAGTDTVYDYVSTLEGLRDLHPSGLQSTVTWFHPDLGSESTLLYKSVAGHYPEWGLGVIREPSGGGNYRPDGGKFILVSGRPYRWNKSDLDQDLAFLLSRFFPQDVVPGTPLTLEVAVPNPVRSSASIRFYLPAPGATNLSVWDVSGRTLRVLRDGPSPVGWNSEIWDGRDGNGHRLPSGVYFTRLTEGGKVAAAKIVFLSSP